VQYATVADARLMSGLRLVLSRGVPGPWGEAAKAIFKLKGLSYIPVAQEIGQSNDSLREWTGDNSAPVAIFERERPRSGWSEILLLAERLASEPRLIPECPTERAQMFGLSFEICGEDGLGWNRRILMLEPKSSLEGNAESPIEGQSAPAYIEARTRMRAKYDDGRGRQRAIRRVVEILGLLSGQLAAQHRVGRRYLVGSQLSALDLYWAEFSNLISILPLKECPLNYPNRHTYEHVDPEIIAALAPDLIAHRNTIFAEEIGLPMDF